MEPTSAPVEGEPSPSGGLPAATDVSPAALAEVNAIAAYVRSGRDQLRSRARLRLAASAIRIAVCAFIALAVAAALAPALHVRMCAVLALLAIGEGVLLTWRNARRARDELAVPVALAQVAPGLADELRSLLELELATQRGHLGKAGAFLLLLRRRVAMLLAEVPIERGLPLDRERRGFFISTGISLVGLVLVGLLAPRIYGDLLATLRHGRLVAPTSSDAPPIVGDLELELRPPSYTGLPTRLLPAGSGDVRVLRGTELVIRARSLVGAVRKASLRVDPDGGKSFTIPGEVTQRAAADVTPVMKAQLTVNAPSTYRFALSRWTGSLTEPTGHRIELEPDLPPRVDLRVPAEPLELQAPRPVELAFEVEDDFGVGEVALVYHIDKGKEQRIVLSPERATPRRARGRYVWELGELERTGPLPSGAKISYLVEAQDNDAVQSPKTARSRSFTIVVRGKADPAAIDHAELEALVEETLGALAGRLEGVPPDRTRAALALLTAHYGRVAKGTSEKSDKGATAALRKIAAEVDARLGPLAADEVKGVHGVGDKIVAELERAVLALDDLRGRRRLEEMARVGEEMKRGRDQLKRLFEELRTATSDTQRAELRREIERKLTELEAKMAELRRIAAQGEGQIPDEFLNKEALGKQDVENGVDSVRKMLERGELDKAMAELDRMSKSLEQLTGAMNKDLRAFAGERNPEQEKAMAAFENDLADLSREEREIEQASRAIRDRAAKDAEAKGGSLKALHDRVRGKLAELDKRAAEQAADGRVVDPETLDVMRARARGIGRALESNDLDEAQSMASMARRLAGGLAERLHETEQEREAEAQARVGDGPSSALKRSGRRMAEVESIARQIEAELSRADSSRTPSLSPDEKRSLDELAKRQQSAAQRGEQLARRMSDPSSSLGEMPQGVGKDLDGARQQIGESGKQLARPAPGRGAEAAQQAAEKLESARKQVASRRQRGEQDGPANEQRDELVRIPGADDSAAPRAFREELLDAMKRGAPHRFEEQARKFYEELVR